MNFVKTKINLLIIILLGTYTLVVLFFLALAYGGPMFISFLINLMFFLLVLHLLLTYIVYNNAVNNYNPNAVLMGFLVFVYGIIGVLVYFLLRKPQDQDVTATSM